MGQSNNHEKAPLFISINRFPDAMPQYHVGHLDLVSAIQAKLHALPGLYLAGNGYRGIGIPDCIKHSESVAESMSQFLSAVQETPGVIA